MRLDIRTVLLLAGLMSAHAPTPLGAQGQDKLKQLLDKAQGGADSQAVEALIERLRRKQPKPAAMVSPERESSIDAERRARELAERERAEQERSTKMRAEQVERDRSEAAAARTGRSRAGSGASRKGPSTAEADSRAPPSIDLEIYFGRNSTEITDAALAELQRLGRALTDPRLADQRFLIAGHTDAEGDPEENRLLSYYRARAVRVWLVNTFAIAPSRLVAEGFGSSRLKKPSHPLSAVNRRVQIIDLSSETASAEAR